MSDAPPSCLEMEVLICLLCKFKLEVQFSPSALVA